MLSRAVVLLYIAIKSLDLPPGSLIATSPVTDASVIGSIVENGHVPYLIDSKPSSYNISCKQLSDRYIPNIRALVLTHAGGIPCNMLDIVDFCSNHNIQLIEDCSQAIGAIPPEAHLVLALLVNLVVSLLCTENLSASGSSGLLYSTSFDILNWLSSMQTNGKR